MLRELAGVDDDAQAAELLARLRRAGSSRPWWRRWRGSTAEAAEALLAAHGGQVGAAVAGAGREPTRHDTDAERRSCLGVDGGGTSTAAWLGAADGTVLGRGARGRRTPRRSASRPPRAALEQAIAAAFADAGLAPRAVAVACLGLAGFDRPEDRAHAREWAEAGQWADRAACWSTTATS